jgi:formiminotetrahydrofolate cyclodeaminase
MHDYATRTVRALLDELAGDAPVPGAGPAAAVVVAAAAALVAMAAGRSRDAWAGAGAAVAQADALRARALRLAARDAAAVEAYVAARGAEGEPPELRDFLVGRALVDAADAPLAICEAADDVTLLAAEVVEWCGAYERADAAAAAALAAGAARAAALLVDVNLATRAGDERVTRAQALSRSASNAADAAARSA